MIEFCKGDLFSSNANVLVNPVNCVGVMGRGLAFQFRIKFPGMFHRYKEACDAGGVKPGKLWTWTFG